MANYFNLRIATGTAARMKPHAAALEWTPNHFAERCVEIVCEMIEDPSKRVVPEIVAMLDGRDKIVSSPMALEKKYANWVATRDKAADLQVAEESPKKRKGKH